MVDKLDSGDEVHYDMVRRTYLITYSQANLEKFPSRQSFAECVVDAFQNGASKATIQHWVWGMENHAAGVICIMQVAECRLHAMFYGQGLHGFTMGPPS